MNKIRSINLKQRIQYCFLIVVVLLAGCSHSRTFKKGAGFEIEWDQASLQQIGKPTSAKPGFFSYPRMTQSATGTLLCVYEHNRGIEIVKSVNGGIDWSEPVIIAPAVDRVSAANPELLELPNGHIIVAYNRRPSRLENGGYDSSKSFSICIKRSEDNGLTWQEEKVLYRGGSDFKNGCWEPAMLLLPTGEVQLFFANEAIYTNSNEQNISMITSTDNGHSWTKRPKMVSFSRGFRDGMPVPVWDRKQSKQLVAIEDNGEGGEFNPSIIRLDNAGDGEFVDVKSPQRVRLLNDEIDKQIYAGAPYIRQLSNGVFVLSVQTTLGRSKDWQLSTMMVAVGKNFADLKLVKAPFAVPAHKAALWNSLCILKDDTIIALSSTNAYNDYTAIWMIRGQLKRNQ